MSKGAATAILIGLLIFVALAWIAPYAMAVQMEWEAKKRRGDPPDYDERQRLSRLRAGNHTLFVLLGFLSVWMAVDQFGWFAWTSSTLDLTLCALLLAWGVWAADCVLHDAFAPWKDKQKNADSFAATASLPMMMAARTFYDCGVCASWLPGAFAAANALALAGIALWKYRRDKKAENGDGAP